LIFIPLRSKTYHFLPLESCQMLPLFTSTSRCSGFRFAFYSGAAGRVARCFRRAAP